MVASVELALVLGGPALPRMLAMVACAGIVPDLLAQRAARAPYNLFRTAYMAFVGAQVGLAVYLWLPFATGLPLLVALVLDQTLFTVPLLLATLVFVRVFGGASLAEAVTQLEPTRWKTSPLWRTLRLNWLFWALFAKPLELVLVHTEVVSALDIVYVDAALIVVWFTILSYRTHAPPAEAV